MRFECDNQIKHESNLTDSTAWNTGKTDDMNCTVLEKTHKINIAIF